MSYKLSETVMLLHETNVLSKLVEKPHTAEALSSTLNLNLGALMAMLNVLQAHGIIQFENKAYSMDSKAKQVFPLIELESISQKKHANNSSYLKSLKNELQAHTISLEPNTEKPLYYQAMQSNSRAQALEIIRLFHPHPPKTIIDIGGGEGSLVTELNKRWADTNYIVVDLEHSESGFQQKTTSQPGKFTFIKHDIKKPEGIAGIFKQSDLIIISNLLHLLTETNITYLIQTLSSSLRPNSHVLFYDYFIENSPDLNISMIMSIDWIKCGTYFFLAGQDCVNRLINAGFKKAFIKKTAFLPGEFVVAQK